MPAEMLASSWTEPASVQEVARDEPYLGRSCPIETRTATHLAADLHWPTARAAHILIYLLAARSRWPAGSIVFGRHKRAALNIHHPLLVWASVATRPAALDSISSLFLRLLLIQMAASASAPEAAAIRGRGPVDYDRVRNWNDSSYEIKSSQTNLHLLQSALLLLILLLFAINMAHLR